MGLAAVVVALQAQQELHEVAAAVAGRGSGPAWAPSLRDQRTAVPPAFPWAAPDRSATSGWEGRPDSGSPGIGSEPGLAARPPAPSSVVPLHQGQLTLALLRPLQDQDSLQMMVRVMLQVSSLAVPVLAPALGLAQWPFHLRNRDSPGSFPEG